MVALALSGCASGAPTIRQAAAAGSGRLDDMAQRRPDVARSARDGDDLPENWWAAFSDPILDQLQALAVTGEPGSEDGRPALRAGARPARDGECAAGAAGGPQWQRDCAASERVRRRGASDRCDSARTRDKIVPLIAEPYGFYQVGFDASWELDLWGRIRSSVEQADADIARQGALLDLARVSLASDVARGFFEVRTDPASDSCDARRDRGHGGSPVDHRGPGRGRPRRRAVSRAPASGPGGAQVATAAIARARGGGRQRDRPARWGTIPARFRASSRRFRPSGPSRSRT